MEERRPDSQTIGQGSLLVAASRLLDPNFQKTVVLIIEHNKEGTLGLVLNRPTETTIRELWAEVSDSPCQNEQPLRVGGPVDGPLTAIHADESLSEKSILPGVHFSVEKDHVEQLVLTNQEPVRFFIGYAGWGPGQLDGEIEQGSWFITSGNVERVFRHEEDLWEQVTSDIAASVLLHGVKSHRVPNDPSIN